MAFNEFDRPLEAQPIQTYVSQHVALPFQEYRAALKDKQDQFDEVSSGIDEQEAQFAKVRALQHDVAYRNEKEAEYKKRIDEAVQKHKGDLAEGSMDFKRLDKELQNDLSHRGALGAMDAKVAAYSAHNEDLQKKVDAGKITKETMDKTLGLSLAQTKAVQRQLGANEQYNSYAAHDPANYFDVGEQMNKDLDKVHADAVEKGHEVFDEKTQTFVKTETGSKILTPEKVYAAIMAGINGNDMASNYLNDEGYINGALKLYGGKSREEVTAYNQEELDKELKKGKNIEPWKYQTDPERRETARLAWAKANGAAFTETKDKSSLADATVYADRFNKALPSSGNLEVQHTYKDVDNPLGKTEEDVQSNELTAKKQAYDNLQNALAKVNGGADFKKQFATNPDGTIQALISGALSIPGMTKEANDKVVGGLKRDMQLHSEAKQRRQEISAEAAKEAGHDGTLYVKYAELIKNTPGLGSNAKAQALMKEHIESTFPLSVADLMSFGIPEKDADKVKEMLNDAQKRYDSYQDLKEDRYARTAKVQQSITASTQPHALAYNEKTGEYQQDTKLAKNVSTAVDSYLSVKNISNLKDLNGSMTNEDGETVPNVNGLSALTSFFGGSLKGVTEGTTTYTTVAGKRFVTKKYANENGNATTFTVAQEDLHIPELTKLGNSGASKAYAYTEEQKIKGIKTHIPFADSPHFKYIVPQDNEVDSNGEELKPKSKPYFEENGVIMTEAEGIRKMANRYKILDSGEVPEKTLPTWDEIKGKEDLEADKEYTFTVDGKKWSATGQLIMDSK